MARIRYTNEVLSILKDKLVSNIVAAELLGCTDTTISKHRKILGMPPRKAHTKRNPDSMCSLPIKYRPIMHILIAMDPAEIVAYLDVSSSHARKILACAKREVKHVD